MWSFLITRIVDRHFAPAKARDFRLMKKDIHPNYHPLQVSLADGTTFTTRSTMKVESYSSEVDSTNHPFYTGKRQFVDTAGRVEKYKRRYGSKTAEDAEATEATEAAEAAK